MNDDGAQALAAALETMGEDRAAEDIAKLRKALALRGYTVVPFPPDPTATVVEHRDGHDRVLRRDDIPERELTVLDGMDADQLLDGVARLATRGAAGGGCRWSPGEAALVLRAVRGRRAIRVTDPDSRWAAVLHGLASGDRIRWGPEDCEAVRHALVAAGYPRP